MRYFDLHCDTLYRHLTENRALTDTELHISLSNTNLFESWTQCFAIWIPDDIAPENSWQLFYQAAKLFKSKLPSLGFAINKFNTKLNAVFCVEGGRLIGEDIEKISALASHGVKMLTLTWNGDNTIACGALTSNDTGLTDFGRKVLKELENKNIIVDVSHLSDKSFFDVAEAASCPFVASHSNSRTVCPNKRNLTDEQFKIIRYKGGLVGLNFHRDFLSCDGNACIDDIIKHCEHFLSLGGEDILAIGSDFDGADMPSDISGISAIPKIYERFLRLNYSETLLDKIFYANAENFFETFDNQRFLL